ncbi:type II toxin-antitoxin system HicB family antitoxin [Cohnella sp. REN36]|uniref:type II toxin-antitoxin system HicB family antitoxin n=1 Tax=Cohnella sp. REN36 TaxID=2887347 RepID=UPI001D157E62|nr:type II toxin-antitoxin system HicB family antitoxin [Cohnella sp. REN36]MCC3375730.1 type II toxin-antitoxin system HicB family antitoxin [Cohnella sp. REN36]
MENYYIYPVVVERGEVGGYGLYFPDFPGTAILHDDLTKAITEAKLMLAFRARELEESGQPLPKPSTPESIKLEGPSDRIVFIEVYMPPYRDDAANKAVTKNCTLPKWLRDAGDEAGVNYSLLLQNAIKEALGISRHQG